MSHPAQRRFCRRVRQLYPSFFTRTNIIIDVGSLDINGNNRSLFSSRAHYVGIDVFAGKNVDVVGEAHRIIPEVHEDIRRKIEAHYRGWCEIPIPCIDVMISTEALEHDRHLENTLLVMYSYLRPGGLMLITCAGDGRPEHGTEKHRPQDSPGTTDFYRNVSNELFSEMLRPDQFKVYHLAQVDTDLQFYGIKA